jgi:hypothetical protein
MSTTLEIADAGHAGFNNKISVVFGYVVNARLQVM